MTDHFNIFPIGTIRKRDDKATIEIKKKYEAALLGLDKFSHIIVLSWFHKNDTPEKRNILRVHPRGDGKFRTRAEVQQRCHECGRTDIDRNAVALARRVSRLEIVSPSSSR